MKNKQHYKKYTKELDKVRFEVVRFIYDVLICIALVALGIYLRNWIANDYEFNKQPQIMAFIFVVLINVALMILRIKITFKNYRIFMFIQVIILTITILFSTSLYGIDMSTLNIVVVITLMSIMVVLGFKVAIIYFIIMLGWMSFITYLQIQGVVPYTPDTEPPNFNSAIMIFTLLFVVLKLIHISFHKMQTYYDSAFKYAQKLEDMNTKLEEIIKARTKTLQDNFNKQIETMYDTSVIGSIAKPLLHDLTTPFSGLKGTLEILNDTKEYDEELVSLAIESLTHINEIIYESKEIMRGKDLVQTFNPKDHLERVIKILNNEFSSNKIKIELEIEDVEFRIKGVVSLYERILINILVNAIEELKSVDYEGVIKIRLLNRNNKVQIEILDNGRGIPKEYLEKVFEEDYSQKHTHYNLGLGLAFVKSTMQEKFKADVDVESKLGKYTKFTLAFNQVI